MDKYWVGITKYRDQERAARAPPEGRNWTALKLEQLIKDNLKYNHKVNNGITFTVNRELNKSLKSYRTIQDKKNKSSSSVSQL